MFKTQISVNYESLFRRIALFGTALFALTSFCACSSKTVKPAIIWTNKAEFASYAEVFNSTHDDAKVIVIYKEEPARSLPPARDEQAPDIVIGSWLKNSRTRKFFTPVDYLLTERSINTSLFYPSLIEYGVINDKQYLLPVSFNLPMIVYHTKNETLIPNTDFITVEQIEEIALQFNAKNKSDAFTAMGYAPSWDGDFLYLVSKLNGADYMEKGTSFTCNTESLSKTIEFFRNWTDSGNTDTVSELNFQFKYLYMPKYKQISTDRCLFAYMPSNEYFAIPDYQAGISFKWIVHDNTIPVEDDINMMGLYKGSKNLKSAEEFIAWFVQESTQSTLLNRTQKMELNNSSFGIAGGFSALRNVNKAVYPRFYIQLLTHMPADNTITTSHILPYRWSSLKERVIIPYLSENSSSPVAEDASTLEDRIAEWSKRYF